MQSRPYDLVAYGGGRSLLAALRYLKTIERRVESIHYVGDLDRSGLDIVWGARRCAAELGLTPVLPASDLHRQMLAAAEAFGHPDGWPDQARAADIDTSRNLDVLAPDLRGQVDAVLRPAAAFPGSPRSG